MLRRVLAIIGVICALAGFVLIPISIASGINFWIPIGLILVSFLILLLVKRMEVPEEAPSSAENTVNEAPDTDGQGER